MRGGYINCSEVASELGFHPAMCNMLVPNMHFDFCECLKGFLPHAILNLGEDVAKCTEESLT